MFGVFYLTFRVGAWPMGWLEQFFVWLGVWITQHWPLESQAWLRSLVVDGIIGGVGGVLIFLPNILLLFLGIAFLEDTGYMARAAFNMDRTMHKIGLHGKSFIPMLIGFGCSVPAIMATRILENRRSRLATMLVIPLMSCGARIAIYAIFVAALFPDYLRGPMMWLIYVIGIVLAIVCIQLLRRTLLKGETIPFVMELPRIGCDIQRAGHPYVGPRLDVSEKGRNHYSGAVDYSVGGYQLSAAAGRVSGRLGQPPAAAACSAVFAGRPHRQGP
jgi:ferrous iron transport protein B